MKLIRDYDKEHDILGVNFGGKVEHSREFFDGGLVLDFNKKDDVVGFEMFDFMERIKDSDKHIRELFEGILEEKKSK